MLDFELLVYHVFKVCDSLRNAFKTCLHIHKLLTNPSNVGKDFEVVLDCTNYTTASEIPMQWFKFFVELTPYDLRIRFRTTRILNCNLHMQRFLRKLYNICSGMIFAHFEMKFFLMKV